MAALLSLGDLAIAQAPPAGGVDLMENLPSLRDQGQGGTFRCPDGTTQTYAGAPPNDLYKSMKCSAPPTDAKNPSPAQQAMDAKNAYAEQQAALNGQSGVRSGLEATVKTGSPNYVLRFRWVWIVGLVAAFAVVGAILSRLLSGRK